MQKCGYRSYKYYLQSIAATELDQQKEDWPQRLSKILTFAGGFTVGHARILFKSNIMPCESKRAWHAFAMMNSISTIFLEAL
jgi:hypothetical protein